MIETVHTFGLNDSLIGIVSEPQGPAQNTKPAVVLLNSGLLPRTGPYRLYVILSRSLARQGFHVLRFDLSGVGDSTKHPDRRNYSEQIAGDIKDGLDYLSQCYGSETFVIMGLCTGADNAHKAAVADERVVGAVFLEGYLYPTIGFYLRYYGKRVFTVAPWVNAIKNMLHNRTNTKPVVDERSIGYFWELPPKDQTERELTALVKRKVELCYIFCETNIKFVYLNQIRDAFPKINFGSQLHVERIIGGTHTYTFLQGQERLIKSISDWMEKKFAD